MTEAERIVYCARCGVELAPGALKYLITIHVTADFDGVLPAEGGMEDLESFMRRLDASEQGDPDRDVYQSQGYLVCPGCRTAFLADPLGTSTITEGGKVH